MEQHQRKGFVAACVVAAEFVVDGMSKDALLDCYTLASIVVYHI